MFNDTRRNLKFVQTVRVLTKYLTDRNHNSSWFL